jgi:hypothetical protein
LRIESTYSRLFLELKSPRFPESAHPVIPLSLCTPSGRFFFPRPRIEFGGVDGVGAVGNCRRTQAKLTFVCRALVPVPLPSSTAAWLHPHPLRFGQNALS